MVRTPSVQNRSLIASGMPVSGANSPRASAASAASACASARSPVTVMKAFSRGFSASIAARCASVSSRAEKSPRPQSVARLRDGQVGEAHRRGSMQPSLDDLGNDEEVPCPLRRVGQHLVGIAAIGHHVLAHLQRHLRARRSAARRPSTFTSLSCSIQPRMPFSSACSAASSASSTWMRASVAMRRTVAGSSDMARQILLSEKPKPYRGHGSASTGRRHDSRAIARTVLPKIGGRQLVRSRLRAGAAVRSAMAQDSDAEAVRRTAEGR